MLLHYVEGKVNEIISDARVTRVTVGDEVVWYRTSRSGLQRLTKGEHVTLVVARVGSDRTSIVIRMRRHSDGYTFRPQMHSSVPLQIAASALLAAHKFRGAGDRSILRIALTPLASLGLLHLYEQAELVRGSARTLTASRTDTVCPADITSLRQRTAPAPTVQTVSEAPIGQRGAAPSSESPWWHSDLLEQTHDAIIIWEMDGAGILYWNQAAENLYGYSRDEAYGNVTHDLLRTVTMKPVKEVEALLARYGVWVGELRHTARNGRTVTVEGRMSLMSQRNGRWLVLEVNRDMTDLKQAAATADVRTIKISTLNHIS